MNSLYLQSVLYYPSPKSLISTCQRLSCVLLAKTGTDVGAVPGMKLSLPKDPSVFVAFMSEIFLSTMILLILLVATVELRRGRAPKIIAIEC
jgi:glycerol uptake facilitator-like aquaporin